MEEEARRELSEKMEIRKFAAKHFFLRRGDRQTHIGFVAEGLIRAFYIDKAGDEITVEFIAEGGFVTHYSTLESPQPSGFYFQCLEPATLILLPYDHLAEVVVRFPRLERFVRLLLEQEHAKLLRRLERQLFDDAETRYRKFMEESRMLMSRISVTDLCSYLGLSRQTLTRIRKNLLAN